MNSKRADGKGHWPQGKRRSPLTDQEVSAAIAKINEALHTHSIRGIARMLGVTDRCVRRYLKGESVPDTRTANLIKVRLSHVSIRN